MCSEAHSQAFDHKRPPQVTARFKSAACWQNLRNSPVRFCQLLSGGCLGMLELFGEEPKCVESGARLAAGISDPSGAAAADQKTKNKNNFLFLSTTESHSANRQFCDELCLKMDSGEIPMIWWDCRAAQHRMDKRKRLENVIVAHCQHQRQGLEPTKSNEHFRPYAAHVWSY